MKNANERPRSITEVRASLEQSNLALRAALQRLEQGARAKVDVGRRIAGKATTVLALGFLVGMVLGMASVRRPVPQLAPRW